MDSVLFMTQTIHILYIKLNLVLKSSQTFLSVLSQHNSFFLNYSISYVTKITQLYYLTTLITRKIKNI